VSVCTPYLGVDLVRTRCRINPPSIGLTATYPAGSTRHSEPGGRVPDGVVNSRLRRHVCFRELSSLLSSLLSAIHHPPENDPHLGLTKRQSHPPFKHRVRANPLINKDSTGEEERLPSRQVGDRPRSQSGLLPTFSGIMHTRKEAPWILDNFWQMRQPCLSPHVCFRPGTLITAVLRSQEEGVYRYFRSYCHEARIGSAEETFGSLPGYEFGVWSKG